MSGVGATFSVTVGVTPPRFALVADANVTSDTPFGWLVVYVFTAIPWHSEQSTGVITCVAGVGTVCDRCPPTRTPEEAPFESVGGTATMLFPFTCAGPNVPAVMVRPAVPWQLEQVSTTLSALTPLMCTVLFTVQAAMFPDVQLYPPWQFEQFVPVPTLAWPALFGGSRWQLLHWAAADVVTQDGVVLVPLYATFADHFPPWQ